MKCDLNCPVSKYPCCGNCFMARAHFVTDKNKHLWDDNGFLGESGCRLSRREMPQECKEYSCKKEMHFIQRRWKNGKWTDVKGELYGKVYCPNCGRQADVQIAQ